MYVLKNNVVEYWKHPVIQCFCSSEEIPELTALLDVCGIPYKSDADCIEFELKNGDVDIEDFLKNFCRLKEFDFNFDDVI